MTEWLMVLVVVLGLCFLLAAQAEAGERPGKYLAHDVLCKMATTIYYNDVMAWMQADAFHDVLLEKADIYRSAFILAASQEVDSIQLRQDASHAVYKSVCERR
jgi:hypothetical protein